MARYSCLTDTNILLRLVQRAHPDYSLIRDEVSRLREAGARLCFTMQNMAEFWNASTRPLNKNGFGMSLEDAEKGAYEIERSFTFLPDNDEVYMQWRRLVVLHRISGVQVHDARLAAAMYAHGLTHILTLNGADFMRFTGLTAIHPTQA